MGIRKYSTVDDVGDWKLDGTETSLGRDGIAILFLAALLRETKKQTAAILRIDERLKRGGFSLAKRNRK